jgi:DNA-binding GntR family transcriptional regulator
MNQPTDGSTKAAENAFVPAIELNRDSSVPLYQQIAAPIERLILNGEIPEGSLIEDEVSMAQRLEVSRPTARHALQQLVSQGLVRRKRGSGTRVAPTRIHRPLGLTSFNDELEHAGFTPSTKVLLYEIVLADDAEMEALECDRDTEIVRMRRIRSIETGPLAIMTNLVPLDVCPSLKSLSKQGLYAAMKESGVSMMTAHQTVGARNATPDDAEQLGVPVDAPLLTMQRTTYDATGRVVEYGNHLYNASLYSIHLSLFADRM